MSEYTPDNWVVIKIKADDPHYRVLAGWSGSYLYGSSWKLNSGITRVEEETIEYEYNGRKFTSDVYKFYGSSGSCYICNKNSYEMRMNTAGVWAQLEKLHGDKIELMPEETDWMAVDWIIGK